MWYVEPRFLVQCVDRGEESQAPISGALSAEAAANEAVQRPKVAWEQPQLVPKPPVTISTFRSMAEQPTTYLAQKSLRLAGSPGSVCLCGRHFMAGRFKCRKCGSLE